MNQMPNQETRPGARGRQHLWALTLTAGLLVASAGVVHAQPDGPLLASARLEAARLAERSAAASQGAAPAGDGWVTRHPILTGMVIGTATGAALSRVDAIGGARHDPRVAFVGTAVGAWGGLIGSAVHKARTGQKVGLGTKLGIAAGAVAAVVVPIFACYAAGGCGGTS